MLTQLTIHNFTLIDHLDLELSRGMTVVSGETGAGKSIMLDALGLTLGDRADSGLVRTGCERAEILACFDVSALPIARAWLEKHDLSNGDDCLLRRVISQEGRSRAYINGRLSPLQSLRELGERLVDIHGQHEHQKLLKKETHRQLLDAFGKCDTPADKTRRQFRTWQSIQKEHDLLVRQASSQDARLQLLTYQVEELDQLGLEDGELASLEQEQTQLANAERILGSGNQALQIASEGEELTCVSLLNQCIQHLSSLNIDHPDLNNAVELFNSALIQTEEACGELGHYLDRVELDPNRLQNVEERLSLCYQIARKHHIHPQELPTLHQQLAEELAGLTPSDARIDALRLQCSNAAADYDKSARALTQQRTKAAKHLQKQVEEQLQHLGMGNCRFQAALVACDASAWGREEIELLISTNPGQPPKPLAKVASGGELSRISLAIQVVTAQVTATPTLAFDEVDVGIGGATAEVVGRLLRGLGEHSQVLCVTHQPQVASQGHRHLRVSKHSNGKQNQTRVELLSRPQRVEEVARMLAGIDVTQCSRDHAEEMVVRDY